jgi:hypothetical protein
MEAASRPAWADRLTCDVMRVWEFVSAQTGIPLSHTAKGIGQLDAPGGTLQAGVIYENMNGVNAWMHTAIAPNTRLTREFVRYCFTYPFDELGLQRLTGWVEASNMAARRLDEHLGFKHEATLAGAASDGGDVLIYVMRREDCWPLRWRAPASMAA